MKIYAKSLVLTIVLSVVMFGFTACSKDTESVAVVESGFSDSDIESMKSFRDNITEYFDTSQKIATSAIKRSRSKEVLMTDHEFIKSDTAVVLKQVEAMGEESLSFFESIGFTKSELNSICSIKDNPELYGMLGVEIVEAINFNDLKQFPTPEGCQQVLKIDTEKAGKCFLSVIGINLGDALWEAAKGGYITKSALKSAVKSVLEKAAEKIATVAAGNAIVITVVVIEWVACYFDII